MEEKNITVSDVQETSDNTNINDDNDVKKRRTRRKKIESLSDEKQKTNNKFVGHYIELFPITGIPLEPKDIRCLKKNLFKKDFNLSSMLGKVTTIVCKKDSVKYCFYYMLKFIPEISRAKYVSIYDIIDVQFGKHHKYTSVRDICAPIILIYVENVTNRLKDEYLLRSIDYWCKKGYAVWVYFKGMAAEWVSHFEKTKNFAMSNKFASVDLNKAVDNAKDDDNSNNDGEVASSENVNNLEENKA